MEIKIGDDFIIDTCPREPGAKIQISTCGSCKFRRSINFATHTVTCAYLSDETEAIQDGIRTLDVKGSPPLVECPKGFASYRAYVRDCFSCSSAVSISWTKVRCAYPKKGADFREQKEGGATPAAKETSHT